MSNDLVTVPVALLEKLCHAFLVGRGQHAAAFLIVERSEVALPNVSLITADDILRRTADVGTSKLHTAIATREFEFKLQRKVTI